MFKFDFGKLRDRGYDVEMYEHHLEVTCSSTGEPVLTQATFRRIYSDLEKTTLTCTQAENLVEAFATKVLNAEMWNIAVDKD